MFAPLFAFLCLTIRLGNSKLKYRIVKIHGAVAHMMAYGYGDVDGDGGGVGGVR